MVTNFEQQESCFKFKPFEKWAANVQAHYFLPDDVGDERKIFKLLEIGMIRGSLHASGPVKASVPKQRKFLQ